MIHISPWPATHHWEWERGCRGTGGWGPTSRGSSREWACWGTPAPPSPRTPHTSGSSSRPSLHSPPGSSSRSSSSSSSSKRTSLSVSSLADSYPQTAGYSKARSAVDGSLSSGQWVARSEERCKVLIDKNHHLKIWSRKAESVSTKSKYEDLASWYKTKSWFIFLVLLAGRL